MSNPYDESTGPEPAAAGFPLPDSQAGAHDDVYLPPSLGSRASSETPRADAVPTYEPAPYEPEPYEPPRRTYPPTGYTPPPATAYPSAPEPYPPAVTYPATPAAAYPPPPTFPSPGDGSRGPYRGSSYYQQPLVPPAAAYPPDPEPTAPTPYQPDGAHLPPPMVSYSRRYDPYRVKGRGSQVGTVLLSLLLVALLVPIPFILGSFTQQIVPQHVPTPVPSVSSTPRPTGGSAPTATATPTTKPTTKPTKTGTVWAADPDLADDDIRKALSRSVFGAVLAWPQAEVEHVGDVIAITDRDVKDAGRLAELSDAALRKTDELLPGRWAAPIVVVLPDTGEDFEDISGRDGDDYGGVTYTNRSRGAVVLNPAAWDNMGETDRIGLLAHEFAHSMTIVGTDFSAEQWVLEGFASWVEAEVAGEDVRPIERRMLYRDVRRSKGPEEVPSTELFSSNGGEAYMQALSVFEFIDDTYGQRKLIAFYTAAGKGTTSSAARDTLGVSKSELQIAWLDWLSQKARQ